MSHQPVPLKLVPPGLLVDRQEIGTDGIVVQAHGASAMSACPACGLASSSVHSQICMPIYRRGAFMRGGVEALRTCFASGPSPVRADAALAVAGQILSEPVAD